jgi:alpha-tubulin suppressor-like RCC1 family protein
MVPVEPLGVKNAKDISCSRNTGFALLNDGTVRAWGYHSKILLGTGGSETYIPVPTPVLGLTDVKQVHTTGISTFALLNDGSVRGWGANPGGAPVDFNYDYDESPGPVNVAYITGISDLQD